MPRPADTYPFLLELLRLDETAGVGFRPGARIVFTPGLRTSGLLATLSGEELRSLLLVLTFVHPNGHIQPSLIELGQALRQPQAQTQAQMRRLMRVMWQGRPLLHEIRRDSGLHAFAPSPRLLGREPSPPDSSQGSGPPAYVAAGRAAVVAHSRAAYTQSREEAERQVAQANGWEWPFRTLGERQDELRQKAQAGALPVPSPTVRPASDTLNPSPMNTLSSALPSPDDLRHDLSVWGVPSDLIERLLADHAPEKIRKQLDWLPLRNALDPARLLVAAIQKDYDAPPIVRKRQALEQALHSMAEKVHKADGTPSGDSVKDADTNDLSLP